MDVVTRHACGDPMVGAGPGSDNWAVMKIAFFDAGGEIGSGERIVLDGTFACDTQHDHAPIIATAPPGTINVQALLLYLQPNFDGGACHFDTASFRRLSLIEDFNVNGNSELEILVSAGLAGAPYGLIYSVDARNQTMQGSGGFAGLWITGPNLAPQVMAAQSLAPFFGGILDGAGSASWTLDATNTAALAGFSLYGIAAQFNIGTGQIEFSNVAAIQL